MLSQVEHFYWPTQTGALIHLLLSQFLTFVVAVVVAVVVVVVVFLLISYRSLVFTSQLLLWADTYKWVDPFAIQ
jgi:hypothetical protein